MSKKLKPFVNLECWVGKITIILTCWIGHTIILSVLAISMIFAYIIWRLIKIFSHHCTESSQLVSMGSI